MARSTLRRTILKGKTICILPLLAFWVSNAQTSDKVLAFEAASIKPAVMPLPGRAVMAAPTGGPGTQDPGRVHYPFISLKALLLNAYDLKPYQIEAPAWINTEMFEVSATMPPETTKEQFRGMLQNLLTERFKLKVRKETKQVSMYSLITAKNGSKMKESSTASPAKDDTHSPSPAPVPGPQIGPDGFPLLPSSATGRPGLFAMKMPGRARLIGQQQTMMDLANRLGALLSRPVGDATGFTAKYDFTLTFSAEGMAAPMGTPTGPGLAVPVAPPPAQRATAGATTEEADNLPDIFRAVKEQLGLALEPKNGPLDVVVIDHIEKLPTEN